MKNTLSFIICLICTSAAAQPFEWVKTGDSLMNDGYSLLAADQRNNVYAIQAGSSAGQSGYWAHFAVLNKFRQDGSLAWKKTTQLGYFGEVNNLQVDKTGHVYLGFTDTGALEEDTADNNMVLYKLDTLGNTIWKAKMKTNPWGGGQASTDADGNTLFSAAFYMENNNYPDSFTIVNNDTTRLNKTGIFLSMINSSGIETWHKLVATDAYPVYSASVNKNFVLLWGRFKTAVSIDGHDFNNVGSDDCFLALFKADGTFLKFKSFKGNYSQYSGGAYPANDGHVYCDSLNNFYLTDGLTSYFSYGNTTVQGDSGRTSVLLQLDTGLNIKWTQKIASPGIFNVNTDNASGLLLNTMGHLIYKANKSNGQLMFSRQDNSNNLCAIELPNGKFVLGGSFNEHSVFGDKKHWTGYYGNSEDYYLACVSSSQLPGHLTAGFSLADSVCEGEPVPIDNMSVDASGFLWRWPPGQSSALAAPTITLSMTGTNTITLISYNGMNADSITRTVYVKPLPDLIITAPQSICPPDSVVSFQKTGTADSILWNYDGYMNQTWYESNLYNWSDTLHWGKGYYSSSLYYTFNIYNKGCSKLGHVSVNNPVPGFATIFFGSDSKLHSGIADPSVHLQWYYNNAPLAGDTLAVLAPTLPGFYKCRFGDSCSLFSKSLYFAANGVNDLGLDRAEPKLVPNPTSSSFEVWAAEVIDGVQILDMTGRIIFSAQPRALNPRISCSLAAGVYFVKISSGNTDHLLKLLVE